MFGDVGRIMAYVRRKQELLPCLYVATKLLPNNSQLPYTTIRDGARALQSISSHRFCLRLCPRCLPTRRHMSRRLPTAASRLPFQVRSSGICAGQCDIRTDFIRVLRFSGFGAPPSLTYKGYRRLFPRR